jgi:hypothetical protein
MLTFNPTDAHAVNDIDGQAERNLFSDLKCSSLRARSNEEENGRQKGMEQTLSKRQLKST